MSSNVDGTVALPSTGANGGGSCQVRVGVRIRPLTHRELSLDGKSVLKTTTNGEIRLGDDSRRRFTYDAVFDEFTGQSTLYQSVAPPLLQAVTEGYNATVRLR
jgi:Kinesin motor domain